MASGFKIAAGTDFDDVFDPYVQGTKPADTGFKTSDGVDLANRYAPLVYGQQAAATGFKIASGADVNTLWARKGSALYSIAGLNGKRLTAVDRSLTGEGNVSATATVSLNSNGTWGVSGSTSRGGVAQPAPTSGTWLPSGESVADYEVQYVVSLTGDGTVSNAAPAYASCATTRACTHTLPPISAANTTQRIGEATITINLRKISTGQVTKSVISTYLETLGFA